MRRSQRARLRTSLGARMSGPLLGCGEHLPELPLCDSATYLASRLIPAEVADEAVRVSIDVSFGPHRYASRIPKGSESLGAGSNRISRLRALMDAMVPFGRYLMISQTRLPFGQRTCVPRRSSRHRRCRRRSPGRLVNNGRLVPLLVVRECILTVIAPTAL